MYCIDLTLIEELPKNNGKHNGVLQNGTATRNRVRMERPVRKMLDISHTSANVHLALPEHTVKLVSNSLLQCEKFIKSKIITYKSENL